MNDIFLSSHIVMHNVFLPHAIFNKFFIIFGNSTISDFTLFHHKLLLVIISYIIITYQRHKEP
jgi:hypothetical protein